MSHKNHLKAVSLAAVVMLLMAGITFANAAQSTDGNVLKSTAAATMEPCEDHVTPAATLAATQVAGEPCEHPGTPSADDNGPHHAQGTPAATDDGQEDHHVQGTQAAHDDGQHHVQGQPDHSGDAHVNTNPGSNNQNQQTNSGGDNHNNNGNGSQGQQDHYGDTQQHHDD